MAPINIDGSLLEGGGQVLRVSVACAAILKKEICINRIRAGRSKPGLKAQHLKGLELIASMCHGKLDGGSINSSEITLYPSGIRPGHYHSNIETAGSVMLLLQADLPVSLYAKGPTHFSLVGGTNADMAPPCDYTENVFIPMAAKFGMSFEVKTVRRGFFPRGGGEVRAIVQPLVKPLEAVELVDRGNIVSVGGVCYASGIPGRIAHSVADNAQNRLSHFPALKGIPINIQRDIQHDGSNDSGFGIVLWAKTDTGLTLGASNIGKMKRDKTIAHEEVGFVAAERLIKAIDDQICVDEDMQNQLIILMGLAEGKSKVLCGELSLHTQTAIQIMHQITQAKFVVTPHSKGKVIVMCQGIGLHPDTLACNT